MNQKINSELHTVASAELQKEIDATLKRLEEEKKNNKDKNETTQQHD